MPLGVQLYDHFSQCFVLEREDFSRLRHNVWVFYDLPGSGTSSPEHLSMTMAKRLSRLRKP